MSHMPSPCYYLDLDLNAEFSDLDPLASEKLTPMMEQYFKIKIANPGCLLFYRMGDFYELFFNDAVIAAQILGIALTKRGQYQGKNIPMCGVPVHAADEYLTKLIASGHHIAICEQLEDPREAKKRGPKAVVERNVTRLITPGTITEDKLLKANRANNLMSLSQIKTKTGITFALAWIDISTGSFRILTTNPEKLLADIMRIDPSELILAEDIFHEKTLRPIFDIIGHIVSPQPPSLFDKMTAHDHIARYYQVATLDGFATFSPVELSAISAIIAYIEKTQRNDRPLLMRPERELAGSVLFIDPATQQNLELMRTLSGEHRGSLIKTIDRTITNGGARLLCEQLMAPLTDVKKIEDRLDTIAFFLKEPSLCQALRTELKGLTDIARALSRLALGRGGPRDLFAIMRGLQVAQTLCALFANLVIPQELSANCKALSDCPEILFRHLEEALADELPLLKRDGGFIRANFHEELDETRALRDQSRRIIAELQTIYANETGIKTLKIKYNHMLGYFIEVTAAQSSSLTNSPEAKSRFFHRQTMANAMRFSTTELADLGQKIAHAADKALTLELELFDRLTTQIISIADILRKSAMALNALDVLSSLAVLAEEQGYCRPLIDNSLTLNIVGGRHPVVEQSLRQQAKAPFIANGCDLSPLNNSDSGAIWLLTGPNMGGKSTFLRQNALIVIMAQMGSFVPAASAHIGIVDRLFSRVGASDDLARGHSTFMIEMVETAAILNQAGNRSFVILDEIGRGTATFDGLSIAWATLEYLHEINHCRAIFATHFHELTSLVQQLSRARTYTMKVQEWEGDVVFLHEVIQGVADRSYGIQVARLAGLPSKVIQRAQNVLYQLEQGKIVGNKIPSSEDPLSPALSPVTEIQTQTEQKFTLLKTELDALDPDMLPPREAIDVLYKLKALLSN